MRGMTLGTLLYTALRGQPVGTDADGNRYYQQRHPRQGQRTRRWVLYAKAADASQVPPEWHAWLHYTTDAPLPLGARKPWQQPHLPNQTGTPTSYRPAGHDYRGGQRAAASGDYQAWTPED